jgi:alkanesulfonate monooxygenase SsuD/methylene tetrahydromethanopterin reductase-like flavin-dependent oxidoreductase (luciferase family)
MTETRYWVQLATEQFPPSDLVRQARAVEEAGFEGLNVSDHFQPWGADPVRARGVYGERVLPALRGARV